ncbi:MAG TPA: biotin carboxylase N-terminal domain-containing protein, partial [Caulobacteraceae bacterium]
MKKLLIANRGEIAIRVARTAAELGLASVAVYAEDDAASLHVRRADEAVTLKGVGAAAYLDIEQIVEAAKASGADAIHPGYGFLSENAAFARACAAAGVTFVGPAPETLELFGDKTAALKLAASLGVPTLPGTRGATTLAEAQGFLASLGDGGAVMLKALAGGGGHGMRPAASADELAEAFPRCASEAKAAFGDGALYAEQFFEKARHVEAQIVGDGTGAVVHLFDRECSLQRQRQKIVEIAPAVGVDEGVRQALQAAAVMMGEAVRYLGLGTIEFLVNEGGAGPRFAFIEANPRLQVEHTVTEEVTGLDLVRLQLAVIGGAKLADVGLATQADVPSPRGVALQARVNLETMTADGGVRPAGGVLSAYEPPSGPGVRVDGFGYGGYRTSVRYDSLLAKVIVHAADLPAAAAKARRALGEFRLVGVSSNIPFLRALTGRMAGGETALHTRYVEEQIAELAEEAALETANGGGSVEAGRRAGAKIDAVDPLAVLAHGKGEGGAPAGGLPAQPQLAAAFDDIVGPEGSSPLRAPLQGTIVSLAVGIGDPVRAGQTVAIMESMKMEHVIAAHVAGYVREITVAAGDTIFEDHPLVFIEAADVGDAGHVETEDVDLDHIRPDLQLILDRHAKALDAARPDAVARRRRTNQRTTRENIDELLDPGSFVEYGSLVVAARRRRNTLEELIEQTPADGLVMGLGRVNSALVGEDAARCAVMGYDYTVLAGTQGAYNHHKMDRLIELSIQHRLPTVFFCEGGGGRPGDTEGGGSFVRGFELWGQMSGVAPMVGVTSGRCFAGNASVLGCCDVIVATK